MVLVGEPEEGLESNSDLFVWFNVFVGDVEPREKAEVGVSGACA